MQMYFHIKYSENPNGIPMSDTPNKYVGQYVDQYQKDSNNPSDYKWYKLEDNGTLEIKNINNELEIEKKEN